MYRNGMDVLDVVDISILRTINSKYRFIMAASKEVNSHAKDKKFLRDPAEIMEVWNKYDKDYVECMWLILQQEKPEDFVIATGVQHSVREFVELAFKYVGIELEFRGEGMDEKGYSKITGRCLVEVSSDFYRPTDVVNLLGDPTKAKNKLGWNPNRTSFEELVRLMVENDMKKVAIERQSEKVTKNLVEYLDNGIVI